jgi:zinc D-Ala-D-Ala dipeptidase
MNGDLVFVDENVPGIYWDSKYATWDNFTGKPVDGYVANRIVGTRPLCAALDRAREEAAALGFGLLLWDGYRPQRAVDSFLRWCRQPEDGRTKPRHYPNIERGEMFEQGYVAARSGHSRGSTVDLTLYHLATGQRARMGGDHDLMDAISHHGAKGIAPVAAGNRQCLRRIMEASGFRSYACEWWHYTLRDEPFPDTYFDVPIA